MQPDKRVADVSLPATIKLSLIIISTVYQFLTGKMEKENGRRNLEVAKSRT